MEATVYGLKSDTKVAFSSVVKLVPKLFLTEIKTLP